MCDPNLPCIFLFLILLFLPLLLFLPSLLPHIFPPHFPLHHFPLHCVSRVPPGFTVPPLCLHIISIYHPPPLSLSIHLWVSGGSLIADGNGSTPEQIDAGRPSPLRAASPVSRLSCLLPACQPDKPVERRGGRGRKESGRDGWLDGRGQKLESGLKEEEVREKVRGQRGTEKETRGNKCPLSPLVSHMFGFVKVCVHEREREGNNKYILDLKAN